MQLIKHGEYTNPLIIKFTKQLIKAGEQQRLNSSMFSQLSDKQGSLQAKALAKNKAASKRTTAFDWLKSAYPNAIEYKARTNTLKGMGLALGLFFLALFGGGGLAMVYTFGQDLSDIPWIFCCLLLSPGIVFTAAGILGFMYLARLELFAPIDEPIIFDRQHRKIYRIFRELNFSLTGLFKPWPQYCVEYDWDLTEVHHVTAARAELSADNGIVFHVLKSADNNELIDFFEFGDTLALNSSTVPLVWEHVRQFMEDNGPHLPPREKLAEPYLPPMSFVQAMKRYVLGDNSSIRYGFRNQPVWSWFVTLIFPISLPMYLWLGSCFWLVHKTAKPIQWPQEVLDAIGKPMTPKEIKNYKNTQAQTDELNANDEAD